MLQSHHKESNPKAWFIWSASRYDHCHWGSLAKGEVPYHKISTIQRWNVWNYHILYVFSNVHVRPIGLVNIPSRQVCQTQLPLAPDACNKNICGCLLTCVLKTSMWSLDVISTSCKFVEVGQQLKSNRTAKYAIHSTSHHLSGQHRTTSRSSRTLESWLIRGVIWVNYI